MSFDIGSFEQAAEDIRIAFAEKDRIISNLKDAGQSTINGLNRKIAELETLLNLSITEHKKDKEALVKLKAKVGD